MQATLVTGRVLRTHARDTHSFYTRGQGPTLGCKTPPHTFTHTSLRHLPPVLRQIHTMALTPRTPAGRNPGAHIPSLLAQNANPLMGPGPGRAAHSSQPGVPHPEALESHTCAHTRQCTYTYVPPTHAHTPVGAYTRPFSCPPPSSAVQDKLCSRNALTPLILRRWQSLAPQKGTPPLHKLPWAGGGPPLLSSLANFS